MDKTEYRMKLDELTSLVEKQDFKGALQVADSIDWRRVKSVKTLSMVADIYEVNKEYERCKEILLLAHSRSMIGKMVLYRLVEISLKLGETEDAAEYYSQFVETAPNDNTRFILKYKIYKAQRAPLEDQIAILEDYKDREYTERWAYELAKLYGQAGQQNKCVEACDDLVLWFAEGRYVMKAMELKMQYEPLSPSQQQKYNSGLQQRNMAAPKAVPVTPVGSKAQESKKRPKDSTNELLQKMDSAGAAITQEANSEREKLDQSIKEAKIDHMPVNSPEFLGKTVDLKEQLAKSIQEVFAGMKLPQDEEKDGAATSSVGDTGEIVVQDLEPEMVEAEAKLKPGSSKKILTKAEPKRSEPKEHLDEVPAKSGAQPKGFMEDFDLEALLKETASNLSEELTTGTFKEQEEVQAEEAETEPVTNTVSGELTEAEEDSEIIAETEADESVDQTSELQKESQDDEGDEEVIEEQESEAATTQILPDLSDIAPEVEHGEFEESLNTIVVPEIIEPDNGDGTKQYEPVRENTSDATREIVPEYLRSETKRFAGSDDTVPMSIEEVLREETPEERRIRILNEGKPEKFSDEQKRIFSYFAKVPGMDQQVLDALASVYDHVDEKTSKHGNIAIMGGYGTGKTRLSEGIVRAICKDLGLAAAKYARIDASDLNKKDPAVVVDKMSGGFLLIERAGLLYPDVIRKLNKAMEFRTDSMVVILEDEKTSMRGMLRNNPEFAKKFEVVISIPVFTNDELVTFARTYARESGYKMDEMGVLALYTLIGDNQTENEPMTISKVKAMVDKAIAKAGKGTRRFGRKMSGKRTDEQNRIILYEKDFDIK